MYFPGVLGSDLWGPGSWTPCHLERVSGTRVYYLLTSLNSGHGPKLLSLVYLVTWMLPLPGHCPGLKVRSSENGRLLPTTHIATAAGAHHVLCVWQAVDACAWLGELLRRLPSSPPHGEGLIRKSGLGECPDTLIQESHHRFKIIGYIEEWVH